MWGGEEGTKNYIKLVLLAYQTGRTIMPNSQGISFMKLSGNRVVVLILLSELISFIKMHQ